MKKRALLYVDHHFLQTPDRQVWVKTQHDKLFWEKYLAYFDRLYVVARMKEIPYEGFDKDQYMLSSTEGVDFLKLPDCYCMRDYLIHMIQIYIQVKRYQRHYQYDIVILRVPSVMGTFLWKFLRKHRVPYVAEVCAQIEVSEAKKIIEFAFSKVMNRCLCHICRNAIGVSYVNKSILPLRYPASEDAVVTNYSSIDLTRDFFYKREVLKKETYTLLHVSDLNSTTKGHGTLLCIADKLNKLGYPVNVIIVGGGRHKPYYEDMAKKMNIYNKVSFLGQISSRNELRKIYIDSDFFVFPSESEGLPRVVIEAMATGLPCITSNVGGIPELLEKNYMHNPNETDEFVKTIVCLITNDQERKRVINRNYECAHDYEYEILKQRRKDFFQRIFCKLSEE